MRQNSERQKSYCGNQTDPLPFWTAEFRLWPGLNRLPCDPHHKHPYPQSQTSGHPAKENSAHNGSNRREAKVSYFTLSGLTGEPTFTVGRLES